MANLSYDEAYSKLKAWGWDDSRIVKALNANGLYKDSKGWGGWSEEIDLWWPDMESPINWEDFSDYRPIDNNFTDKEWNEHIWEMDDKWWLTAVDSSSDKDNTAAWIWWINSWAILWYAWLKWLIKKYWTKAVTDAIKKYWVAWLKWLGKAAWYTAATIWTIYQEYDALKNEIKDLNEWNIGNTGNAWKDAGQWALYNADKMAFDVIPDSWYYNQWEDKIKAQDAAERNANTMDTYKKLWWNRFSNLTGLWEWWYLAEEKNIKKNYWGDWLKQAEDQLREAASNMSTKQKPVLNDADFKKFIIDEWYKFWNVKNKDWSYTKTWYKETGKNNKGQTTVRTITMDTKDLRQKYWASNEPKKK